MHILLLSLWYTPEPVAKPHDLAVELTRRGHQVTVITGFPNYPHGELYAGYQVGWRWEETIDGVRVLRVWHVIDRSHSAVRRILSYATFSLRAVLAGLRLAPRPDVLWTYQIGMPGVLLSWLKRVPLVHEVQDLWPEWALTSGVGLRGWLFNLLNKQERFIYRRAQAITTISEGFRRTLTSKKQVSSSKIALIPNWANEENFKPVPRDEALAQREGLAGRFNIIYGGNLGTAQGLHTVLEAARQLSDLPGVQFILIGDGVERERLLAEARFTRLDNVRFLGSRPPQQMADYLACADALLIHLLPDPMYAITIPSKTYGYLASGKPILAAALGDVADLVQQLQAGKVCQPGNAATLADAVRQLYHMPVEQREALGSHGRAAFEQQYTRAVLVKKYEMLFEEVTGHYVQR
ncbi:Glycogen synthase [Anaerolineae bacterium]|nr:Glycogen synthase [Anaerolineae bacterium]